MDGGEIGGGEQDNFLVGADAAVVRAVIMGALFVIAACCPGRHPDHQRPGGNRFGHPHAEELQRAADADAAVLRIDELGTIEVITNGQAVRWEARKKICDGVD
jgi:hypothetical protein